MQHPDFSPIRSKLIQIRHHLHTIPGLGLSEIKTPAFVADQLEEWGYTVHRGIAKTGLVATLQRGQPQEAVGFRADFDALPINEETGVSYRSQHPGAMHACGHDGHTTMLLGAAWALAQDPSFSGTVHFIFQPAEENFGGAKLMMDDGLFERFPGERIFALHNLPRLEVGRFATRPGAIAASIDVVTITVKGRGGHGALPETTIDPSWSAQASSWRFRRSSLATSPRMNVLLSPSGLPLPARPQISYRTRTSRRSRHRSSHSEKSYARKTLLSISRAR